MAFTAADHKRQKNRTKRLAKNLEENSGIASKQQFENEDDFQKWLTSWLKEKTIYRYGDRQETKDTKNWDKIEKSKITDVTREPHTNSGFGDIAIHHEFLHLSWNHILASPFILECKDKDSFRYAAEQSVRYKKHSNQKYEEKNGYKILRTGIATPQSLKTAEITSRHGLKDPYPVNFEAKRIFWNLGVGVTQSANPDELVVSFNEGDVVMIK